MVLKTILIRTSVAVGLLYTTPANYRALMLEYTNPVLPALHKELNQFSRYIIQ
jgi:hypothetical protein